MSAEQSNKQTSSASHTELEQISKLTGELAHEIKNPLSTVKVNLKLIDEELSSADLQGQAEQTRQSIARARRKISIIQNETDRLERILEGFLRYVSRPEPQLAAVDIIELTGDMVDFFSPQAYGHSITIRHSLAKAPLVCKIDGGMLKQAILNLFLNAQQATKDGGELMIKVDKHGENARIQISDTGSGIAPERLEHIFDAHYSSRPGGSGLGLPTAKRIVQAHNGTLSVTSELGKGTAFTIEIPLAEGGKDNG